MENPLLEDLEFLEHFGVKGMRWGVRKERQARGVSRKTDREASKDAKEFARAKMYFGQGAGTRRKLIKAKVEDRSKRDSSYAKAFDHHLKTQDMSKHSDKARSERKRTDRKDTLKKSAGQIARSRTGEMGTKAAFTALAVGGATFLNSAKGRQMMNKGKASVKVWVNSGKARKVRKNIEGFFANQ